MAIARSDETDLLIPLHEGVHETPPWRVFLLRLTQRLRAAAAIVVQIDDRVTRYATGGEAAGAIDPWLTGLRAGRVYAASEQGDAPVKGFGRIVRATTPDGASAWIVTERDGRDFRAADGALLAALAPHLAAALRTHAVLTRARLRDAVTGVALQRAAVGWVALGRDARVIAASDGEVAQRGERIAAVRSEAGGVIAAYCLAPSAPVAVPTARGPMLLVPGAGGGVGGAAAIGMFVTPRDNDDAARAEALRALYGLAPSEARLAAAVAGGASLAEAAAALGLTIETARNYSKRVFAKMRVRGQADLVRVAAESVVGMV